MRPTLFAFAVAALACVLAGPAAAQSPSEPAVKMPAVRDGSHDFDWMVGTWKAHLKRLENPLTGSTKWVEFDGIQRTWLAWGGRSAMDEFTVEDAATKTLIDALTVRLYDKTHDQWSIYWANAKNGAFPPEGVNYTECAENAELQAACIVPGVARAKKDPASEVGNRVKGILG